MKETKFTKWLDIFIKEKGIDIEHVFEVYPHAVGDVTDQNGMLNFIPVAVVLEHI